MRSERTFIEQARRAQLLDAAVAVLADGGYEAASLARIAAHAGVSKGVVSYHFAGKAELLHEVVRSVSEEAAAYMTQAMASQAGAAARLGAYVRSNLVFMGERRAALQALIEVLIHAPPPSPYAELQATALASLAQLLAAGQRSGEFGSFSPAVLALAIRGAIDAVPGRLALDPELDLAALGDELARLFVKAARP